MRLRSWVRPGRAEPKMTRPTSHVPLVGSAGGCFLVHLFSLEVCGYRIEHRVEISLKDGIQLVQGQPDPMIRYAVFLEVVGSNLLAAVARAHHTLPVSALLCALFLQLNF